MNKLVLILAASLALSLPSAANAGSLYAGVETGLLFPRGNDVDEFVSFSATQTPASPAAPAPPVAGEFDDVFGVEFKQGYDLDVIGGYDFGFFRLELELAHKQASLKDLRPDDITDEFLAALNTTLNRPSVTPDPGAPSRAALTTDDFNLGGRMRVSSVTLNGLLDLALADKLWVYGGGGIGRSSARAFGDRDGGMVWQYIAGVRYAVNRKVELGFKYRYFNSGVLKLRHDPITYAGNPNRVTVTPPGGGAADVDQTIDATLTPEFEGRFRTRNLLASVIFNL